MIVLGFSQIWSHIHTLCLHREAQKRVQLPCQNLMNLRMKSLQLWTVHHWKCCLKQNIGLLLLITIYSMHTVYKYKAKGAFICVMFFFAFSNMVEIFNEDPTGISCKSWPSFTCDILMLLLCSKWYLYSVEKNWSLIEAMKMRVISWCLSILQKSIALTG